MPCRLTAIPAEMGWARPGSGAEIILIGANLFSSLETQIEDVATGSIRFGCMI
jgi:hypothetical protein